MGGRPAFLSSLCSHRRGWLGFRYARLERVRKRFSGFAGPVPEYLAALSYDEQLHCGPIEWVERDRSASGRVVLIGDAAHAGPPMMAQGGCMAMEDALVLAEVLRAAESVESALDTYAARRRPRADWVQQHSRAVGESFLLPPATHNAAFRERGDQGMYDRFDRSSPDRSRWGTECSCEDKLTLVLQL